MRGDDKFHQLQLIAPSGCEVSNKLSWEKVQVPLMHGQTKPTSSWGRSSGDTLESVVHQAKSLTQNMFSDDYQLDDSSGQKYSRESPAHMILPAEQIHEEGRIMSSTYWSCWEKKLNEDHQNLEHDHDYHHEEERGLISEKININSTQETCFGARKHSKKRVKEHYSTGGKNNSACIMKSGHHNQILLEESGSKTMITSGDYSFESSEGTGGSSFIKRSCAARNTMHDHAAYHLDCSENNDEECLRKGESFRSQSSSRRSATHNLSERRRRDRINEKMKALQKMVPNASKTDKASMLDEVIEYLKRLQAQVQMMSNARNNMRQMVMPLAMQQQLQIPMMTPMGLGMGIGMGMVGIHNLARYTPQCLPTLITAAAATSTLGNTTPPLMPLPFTTFPSGILPSPPPLPPFKATTFGGSNANLSIPNLGNQYNTFPAQQSMNMDFFNKIASLYQPQTKEPSKK